ncbi:hypothetical protein FLONG3_3463 [Fusarium longipes]|uniref:Uncharacterized protein n=1 Tax=Fusarium longipes TaxID=694270 RepID=A0A395T1D0_9HYPO|nr:hypothetical protein FLONG3_3463 [Fusarium longipes]
MTVTAIATHLRDRRLRLLGIAQTQLGLFLNYNTVAYADSVATEVCNALDAADIPLHPSLRVASDYQSVFFCRFLPLRSFKEFWQRGFYPLNHHNCIGLTPIMVQGRRWFGYEDKEIEINTINWLTNKGFMQQTAKDPLKLGLNVYATGYHYAGAMSAGGLSNFFVDVNISDAVQFLESTVLIRDNCLCWCNEEGHGCSPIKTFLKNYTHNERGEDRPTRARHFFLHHGLPDTSGGEKLSPFVKEALRLLTFEALEMTHTCCSYDQIYGHDHDNLVSEENLDEMAIFHCDPDIVSEIRSCDKQQASAILLEDLMAEFTEQIQRAAPGPYAFEEFIYTHWRRRISGLYTPDPTVVNGLRQHQAFQGLGSPLIVRTGEYVIYEIPPWY